MFNFVCISVAYFSSFEQHNTSILFCVCKECGDFLYSFLGVILMLSGTSLFVFVGVCLCGRGGKINQI